MHTHKHREGELVIVTAEEFSVRRDAVAVSLHLLAQCTTDSWQVYGYEEA